MSTLLDGLLSGDTTRILSSAHAIVRSWDIGELGELAAQLPKIRAATLGVAVGGAVHPNSGHIGNAIMRLEYVRDRKGCLCALYGNSQFSDPRQEAARGHLQIHDTVLQDGVYVDFYTCECLHCGARYRVIERDYHYTWWGWIRV